jgi:hypothetical protein
MSLKDLKIPDDVEPPSKQLTPFERKRAAATTYEDLVALGYEEGMEFPEAWAKRVWRARNQSILE